MKAYTREEAAALPAMILLDAVPEGLELFAKPPADSSRMADVFIGDYHIFVGWHGETFMVQVYTSPKMSLVTILHVRPEDYTNYMGQLVPFLLLNALPKNWQPQEVTDATG